MSFSLLFAGLFLALLEGGLRVSGWPDPGLYDGDTASLWTLRAGLVSRRVPFPERGTTFRVRTNTMGFRSGESASGAILCLGDSTTFGWGVEEEEAWPARLSMRAGVTTVNGGVPGYSTVQGLATLDHALSLRPRGVVLAFLVRDAERGVAPDRVRAAAAPPRPPPLAILRALRSLRGPIAPPLGDAFRVPPEEYAANLRALVARVRAAGAEAWVLAFPMRRPPTEHLAALATLDGEVPVLAPTLPEDAFFAEDPIHLTPEGNAVLAERVAAAFGAAMREDP